MVEIEDEIMKPLVAGVDAKRYLTPETNTYLLYPYTVAEGRASLIPASRMASEFPRAWTNLLGHEATLRTREDGKFDNDEWYQFGRSQNLGKQNVQKIIVPRLVMSIACAVIADGRYYLDNVDVGGAGAARNVSPYFLAAVLRVQTH